MPIPFAAPIDMQKNELQNAVAQSLASDPSTPAAGQFYYNSASAVLKFYTGSAWVVLGRLDQISVPTGTVGMNSQRIINTADPVNPQDVATKAYADSIAQGIDGKPSVRGATTAALAITARTTNTLTIGGTTFTVDGVTYANGDRILVKDSTTGTGAGTWDNGIYSVSGIGTSVVLTRPTDMDVWTEVPGAFTFVETGTINADSGWLCTADQGGTLGTTAITWTQFSQTGTITASNVGTGQGVFKQKTGSNLEFYNIKAGSTKIAVALSTNDITVDVTEANLTIANMGGSVPATKMPALTGDVTTSAGAVATTIATGAVTDTKASLSQKPSVKYASIVNIASLSGTGVTVDGNVPSAGDTVLCTAQSTGSQNGPWVVNAGAWTRPTWWPSGGTTQAAFGVTIRAMQGSANMGEYFVGTTGAITIDTTSISISPVMENVGANSKWTGALAITNGGTGSTSGAGGRANLGAAGKFAANVGNGSLTSWTVTHNLGTTDVQVQVWELTGSLRQVNVETQITSANVVTLIFSIAPASNAYRVVVIG